MKRFIAAAAVTVLTVLSGCANADLSVDTPESGIGQVTSVETLPGANAAVYTQGDTYDKLRFGKLNVNFVEIDSNRYVADWNDLALFQTLKAGDKVGFSSSGRFVRLEGSGGKDGNYRQIVIKK